MIKNKYRHQDTKTLRNTKGEPLCHCAAACPDIGRVAKIFVFGDTHNSF